MDHVTASATSQAELVPLTSSKDGIVQVLRPMTTWQTADGLRELRQARALAAVVMTDQSEEVRDTVVLLTNELVTNALKHAEGEFHLSMTLTTTSVRVNVRDRNPRAPVVLTRETSSECGRGMAIVDALATCWGTAPHANGKTVWFELQLD